MLPSRLRFVGMKYALLHEHVFQPPLPLILQQIPYIIRARVADHREGMIRSLRVPSFSFLSIIERTGSKLADEI